MCNEGFQSNAGNMPVGNKRRWWTGSPDQSARDERDQMQGTVDY